jgi:hypothetical protein
MKRRTWRRRTVIIDPKTQAKIFAATSLPMFACLVIAVGGEFLYQHFVRTGQLQTDGSLLFGMPDSRLGMLLLFVSASTIQVVASLIASQKVAGTAYHISRILNEFRAGNRDARVRLRRGDYQQSLGTEVNGFLQWVQDGAAHPTLPEKHGAHAAPGSPETSAPGSPRPHGSRPEGSTSPAGEHRS